MVGESLDPPLLPRWTKSTLAGARQAWDLGLLGNWASFQTDIDGDGPALEMGGRQRRVDDGGPDHIRRLPGRARS